MKNVFLTFFATAFVFTSTILYGFMSGKVEYVQHDYLAQINSK